VGKPRLKLAPEPPRYDEAGGYLEIVASVEMPDRDGEVVVPSTIRLDEYRKNPVVIWAHDRKSFPIAKCEDPAGNFTCWLDEGGRLRQRWYFADTAEGRLARDLYRQGVLRGASIGFLDDGLRDVSPAEAEARFGVRRRLRQYLGGELLETSAVPVPSCPGSLSLGWVDAPRAAGLVGRGGPAALVTKALAAFPRLRQATRGPTVGVTRPVARDAPHPGANPVSTTAAAAATDTTKPADAAGGGGAAVTKDMGTTSDAAGGSPDAPPPHEQVKAGLESGMHEAVRAHCAGEITKEEMLDAIGQFADDHAKYSGNGGDDDPDKTGQDDDGDEETKAVAGIVEKVLAPVVGRLEAALDKLDALPSAEELAEELARR